MTTTACPDHAFAPALDHLRACAIDHFGVDAVRIDCLEQSRGGFTRVLKVRVHAGAKTFVVFVKVYAPTSAAPEERARQLGYLHAETERLAAAARIFEATPSLAVPPLMASLPESLAIVTAEVRGTRLDAVLRRACLLPTPHAVRRAETALRLVGEWLREFQRVPRRDPAAVHKDYRAYLDDRLRRLVAETSGVFTTGHREAALGRFDDLSAQISPADKEPAAAHADLCPANVLVAERGIAVIDFAMSTDRVRTLDLAHMYFHLELLARRITGRATLVRRLERALVNGYSPEFDVDTPLFQVMLQQHAICYLTQWAGVRLSAIDRARFKRRVRWALHIAAGRTDQQPPAAATLRAGC